MSNKEIVVFLDGVSRTIAGVKIDESEATVTIQNPVIINAVPKQGGQMGLQLIPVFFREVLKDKNQDCEFTYHKSQITQTTITKLEDQIEAEYATLFRPISEPIEVTEEPSGAEVIDLFDEGK